jgi:wyosine [tRNA(Phe)-imidazoG37] synthetase (radical SAM superfamily)
LNFGSNPEGDYCNSKCIYCSLQFSKPSADQTGKRRRFIMDTLRYAADHYDASNLTVYLDAGEITVSAHCDEALRFVKDNGMRATVHINAFVYNEGIADLPRDGGEIYVSLDAGTPETFAKIKGVDCRPRVMSNLERYALCDGSVILKYIVLDDVNGNAADICGFLDVARKSKAGARLSSNNFPAAPPEWRPKMSPSFSACFWPGLMLKFK